jgi:hypothetical protein
MADFPLDPSLVIRRPVDYRMGITAGIVQTLREGGRDGIAVIAESGWSWIRETKNEMT